MATVPIVTDVTYDGLVSLIAANNGAGALETGLQYKVTDFKTVHYMCNGNGVIVNPQTMEPIINEGVNEPLILVATSPNTVGLLAQSTLYPNDIINYDYNYENWLQDAAFSSDQINIVPGFKGVITRREDTENSNVLGYDFRNVKFRRYKKNYPLWDQNTTYNISDLIQVEGSGVYMSTVDNNINNLVSDTTKWCKIISYDNSEYWEHDNTVAKDVNDYEDYLTFVENGTGTYSRAVKNNKFSTFRDTHDQFWGLIASILTNNVFFLSSEDNYSLMNNSFGAWFEMNTFDQDCSENNIGNNFQNNIIGKIFSSNVIYDSFGGNIIGTTFRNNKIGKDFYSNKIGNAFNYNEISSYFRYNSIKAGFTQNTCFYGIANTDFLSAVKVYGEFSCELIKTSTGTLKLRYIDGSDNTQKIVDVTS